MIETTIDGRYQILSRIATGGMGEVYRAHDPILDREVALKVLQATLAGDPGFIDRFRREARSTAMIGHQNIVAVHDWGETGDTYFMIMEYVRGPNLRTILLGNGPLQPAQAVEIAIQVLAALEHAHRRGIVHRDVKPENILITEDGMVKVADFGLSRALAESRVTHAPGTVTGTVQYLAPEQIEGEPADQRTDLYATGILLYELLVGEVPFSGETSVAIAYKHLRDRVPPPSRANPMVPPSLDAVVAAATEKDRERRTSDAAAMRRELERVSAELPPAPPLAQLVAALPAADQVPDDRAATVTIPRAMSPRSKRRRLLRRVVSALFLVAVLGGAAWATWEYVVPHMRTVPEVEGRSRLVAQRALEAAELEMVVAREEYSSEVASGHVIRQTPPPGRRLERHSEVSVVLSLGPELVKVPDVSGRRARRATQLLEQAKLRAQVVEEYHEEVGEGRVIDQNPAAGTTLEANSRVRLRVSRGPEPREVPDLRGEAREQATAVLQGLLLVVRVTEAFSTDVGRGRVISQEPGAGSRVAVGSTVTIVVSKGPRQFPMPDVVGMSQAAATQRLEGLGLDVDPTRVPGSSGNTVVGQQPNEGVIVEAGQEVTIYLGGG